jgi:hypothetical protein
VAFVDFLPPFAGAAAELGDPGDGSGRAGDELPGRAPAGVAERMDSPGRDEHGRARRRAAPPPAEQILDLALKHVEDLVEVLVPVRDRKAAARREFALHEPDLGAQRQPDLDRRPAEAELDRNARARRYERPCIDCGHGALLPAVWCAFLRRAPLMD